MANQTGMEQFMQMLSGLGSLGSGIGSVASAF